ncbi:MAG: BamA/TamA family outer membrane protein [Bacteroidota bacterium]
MPRRFRLASALLVVGLLLPALPAAAQYHFYFGRNKVQYDAFDWHVLQTDHFDIYYYPEMQALAEHGAHFAEESYEELENRFNFSLGHRVPMIFYSSNLHFKQTNVTPGFIPDGVGGFFEFLKGRVVIPANGNLHRFRRVIRHELVHVFTYSKLTRVMRDHRRPFTAPPPLWFTEGIAEYWSGEPDFQHEMVLRDAVASNYFVPLDDLDRIFGTYLMYKEGEAVCRFIAETYGEDKLLRLFEEIWRDPDFRKVMEHVLREDYRAIADRWTAWVHAQYLPKLDEATPPTLVSDAVAARGFNGKPTFFRHADGRREIAFVANRDGYTSLYAVEVDAAGTPTAEPRVLVRGERNARFEAFHFFESQLDVSGSGQLAFVTKSGDADVVHVYDLARDQMGETYRFPGLVAVYSPSWDPTGTRLAFTGIERSGFSDLYTYDTRAGALRKLTNDTYDDRDPAWSPDGSVLAFSSDRTEFGETGHYNLFTLDLAGGQVEYVTRGPQMDLAPDWSPDGERLVFISSRREADGKFSGQNLWVADLTGDRPVALADASGRPLPTASLSAASQPTASPVTGPTVTQLTDFTGAAFDPVWTDDGRLLFSTLEDSRFTIRQTSADSLLAAPRRTARVGLVYRDGAGETDGPPRGPWSYGRLEVEDPERRRPYRKKYSLDAAQGALSTNPVWGTNGGAVLAFSDLLGNDQIFVSAYSTRVPGRSFVDGLNASVTRIHLGRRANYGYGAYRFSGQRFDLTDPDAVSEFPVFFEELVGAVGLVSYPLSKFQRVDVSTSLNYSRKEIPVVQVDREAVLLSNALSVTHDNALYGFNGPVDGWKATATAAYTTDVRFSNVSYYTLRADLRHYLRIVPGVTFASWGLAQTNVGREARLFLLGGSWDLRGFPLFRVRGQHMWFTSHELRFPILERPSAYLPILAPFGIVNLRGAAFADAAHVWNGGYNERQPQLFAGTDLGALGLGLRMNIFGGFVLRYDVGWRFTDGLDWDERDPFRQFFFGYNF